MLFLKPQILIYLNKNELRLYLPDHPEVLKLPFPAKLIENLEVVNSPRYQKLIEEFLSQQNLNYHQAIITLSSDIIFTKNFPPLKPDQEKEVEKFFSMIPFPEEDLIKRSVEINDQIYLIATNKKLFQPIIDVLDNLGCRVIALIPLSFLPDFQEEKLTPEVVKDFFVNMEKIKALNLLPPAATTNLSPNWAIIQKTVIVTFFLILFGLIWTVGERLGFLNNPLSPPQKNLEVVIEKPDQKISSGSAQSSEKNSSPSSQISAYNKVKVQILNGSGVAGQASQIRQQLAAAGFKNIEVDNAPKRNLEETIASFSASVSASLRQEIIKQLEIFFTKINTQENSTLDNFNVIITTGQKK